MAKYMATFGVQYSHDEHPSGKPVDPDGYVLIHADSEAEARRLMVEEYGNHYAFIYPEHLFGMRTGGGKNGYDYHPLGLIATLGAE